MSKPFRLICGYIAVLLIGGIPCLRAQDIDATIKIDFRNARTIHVEGRFNPRNGDPRRRSLSFLTSIAGVPNLADRVSEIRLLDSDGQPVAFRKLAAGEYFSESEFEYWSYKLDLSPLKDRIAAAHVSWSDGSVGVLMLGDILPIVGKAPTTARIRFADVGSGFLKEPVPIYSTALKTNDLYDVLDVENSVLYTGYRWEVASWSGQPELGLRMILSGTWNFGPPDFSTAATEVHTFYKKVFGAYNIGRPIVAITNFPVPTPAGQWQAETRGSSVTIISSDMPFKSQSIQRLHEQLRHELFHLWIPNDVNLTGNYDWFYEGFALYESLKMAVAMNRISFPDLLDTLSRAHTIDSANSQRTSLIDASKTRFGGANTQVYARGMLVAFLADLELLQRSKGKRSVEDFLREFYRKHKKPAAPADGNAAVVELFKSNPGLDQIINKFITGVEKIDWTSQLAAAGISDSDPGPITTLKVNEKLSGRQKTLLDKLGYNNWRKLTPVSR